MSKDDLDAVRTVADALKGFEPLDQERILRWARELAGLGAGLPSPVPGLPAPTPPGPQLGIPTGPKDIKNFVLQKAPKTDNQFAAVVAYFYRFEAPASEQKTSIGGADLQDAARKAGRPRLKKPSDTLNNAHKKGLLDKAGHGAFALNTVGENLVAMTLPGSAPAKPRAPKKGGKKKSARKAK